MCKEYACIASTCSHLTGVKRSENITLQQRYATGLEKLNFASSQVHKTLTSYAAGLIILVFKSVIKCYKVV